MLETELKCMLDKQTYLELEKMFKWDRIKEQTNNYYTDPCNELKKNGITLRVRTKDNINKLQIKVHKNADSPLQICEEAEYDIADIPDNLSPQMVKDVTGLEVPAARLGSLTTLRHSLMYTDGVEICLDENNYLDKTDYEIEVEYTREIPAELMEKLSSAGVRFETAAVGKCTRFMQRLAAILRGEE
ncbi:MAG: CYTH domain-containing protein [Clostridiales bacterium]|nr:CYTH domain-containing protein [Clostridiales bacterium]